MRHALILAGGSGTRLWPMSREKQPKQLLSLIDGKSLLEIAYSRLETLVPEERRFVCAAERHWETISTILPNLAPAQYLGEPTGRDTLAALGFSSAVIAKSDPQAVVAVFSADHLVEPLDEFVHTVNEAYKIVENSPSTLMTYGIAPTFPATGFGYLELGKVFAESGRIVDRFIEKPEESAAQEYLNAGQSRYLWNSGMFVWNARTFLDCIKVYEPEVYEGISAIADAWGTDSSRDVLASVYPGLKKISVDFAVMEPASRDSHVHVAALHMPLSWLDVGSWPAYAEIHRADTDGNVSAAAKSALLDCRNVLAVSNDPDHVVSVIGCEDIIVVHTEDATLVCTKNQAEKIKNMRQLVADQFGNGFV